MRTVDADKLFAELARIGVSSQKHRDPKVRWAIMNTVAEVVSAVKELAGIEDEDD